VFPQPGGIFGAGSGGERSGGPLIVPIAIPAIAGPSALATVMLLASRSPGRWPYWVAALTGATIVSAVILIGAQRIARWIGDRGIEAMERLMGLVLTAIAIQMLLGGIEHFVQSLR